MGRHEVVSRRDEDGRRRPGFLARARAVRERARPRQETGGPVEAGAMKRMLLLATLLSTAPVFADVSVKNSTDATLTFVLTEKPVTPAQQELLTKYNYRGFKEAHKGCHIEGGVRAGESRTLPWKSKGHLLLWHFDLNGPKSTFVAAPVARADASVVVTKQGGKFTVQSK